MGRAPCCEKVGLKKGRWTAEEDEILAKYIQANGEGSWRSLPKNAGLLRCGKSCRLRWINYLRADLKRGNITAEEENTIVKLHASFGNRWSLIASHLPGRTDNEIKNYWNSHLSRKIYCFSKVTNTETQPSEAVIVTDTPKVTPLVPPKRKGGRTSRWAMKKNKSYTQNKIERPIQSSTQQQNSEVAVPPPATPSPVREALCNIEDFMALDADVAEVGEGKTEELEVNRECEKNLNCVKESCGSDDDILGLCEFEGINEGCGAFGLSDMLETCGVWDISEEIDSNDVVGVGGENERCGGDEPCHNKASSSETSGNGESSADQWCSNNNYSCSSMTNLGYDDKWNWESVIEFNNVVESETNDWEQQENLLTTLWEDEDWESDSMKLGGADPNIQKDMVAWLLS